MFNDKEYLQALLKSKHITNSGTKDALKRAIKNADKIYNQISIEAFSKELTKVIEAGNNLAAAAHRVQSEYDGIHRLRIALAGWYKMRADEFDRATDLNNT